MDGGNGGRDGWARLRFSIVGPLLASPPAAGGLGREFERLASRDWRHPATAEPVRFAAATIERWYYLARAEDSDPVGALCKRRRSDAGFQRSFTPRIAETLRRQYAAHPGWTVQLHYDNLVVVAGADPAFSPLPSYPSVLRFMRAEGLRRTRPGRRMLAGEAAALRRRSQLETRGYEVERVHGLWHADFHTGSLRVLRRSGEWIKPVLLTFIDDRSRLLCHGQWYFSESARSFVHGLVQALLKRTCPRSLMVDNGSAMAAGEVVNGLEELGILRVTTRP